MIVLESIAEMRGWSRAQRAAGRGIGLVPTMGSLHDGHLQLVDEARRRAAVVVLSIFVNPLQFGPGEDFERYPRDVVRDRGLAQRRGVTCLFVPTTAEMYPEPAVVRVSPGALAAHLCGPHRPGHFEGVLTVVAKLLHIVEPDVAVFGRKDAQQARLIARMAADLDFATDVVVAPTARETDGLAMSSRNRYLTPGQRTQSAAIPRALEAAHAAFTGGESDAGRLIRRVRGDLEAAGLAVEYVEAVDPHELAPRLHLTADTLLAVAVRAGATRLIDNIVLGDGVGADRIAQA